MATNGTIQEESHSSDNNRLLEHLHIIRRIVPRDQEVLSVKPDTLAREAIEKMKEHGFSQLPVASDGVVHGVFSYRAFALEAIRSTKSKVDPGSLRVRDFLAHEEEEYAHFEDRYQKTIGVLDRNNCVIISGRDNLEAIVTPMDVLQYLDSIVDSYIKLIEIEKTLRAVIRDIFSSAQRISGAIERSLSAQYKDKPLPKALEYLTFDQLVTVICNGDNYKKLKTILGEDRKRTRSTLIAVRDIRNKLFHFRGELSKEEKEDLAYCNKWLNHCCR